MSGNHPVASSDPVVSSPQPPMGSDVQTNRGAMAVQAGGHSADIEYLPFPERPPSRPASEDRSGPWNAILSFFGVRKAPPLPKRPPSVELQSGPSKPARQDPGEATAAVVVHVPEPKPTQPFPFLDLPFEMLCEVIERVPVEKRHLCYGESPLGTTCKAFHAAITAVSQMPQYRDDDAVVRRVVGMRTSAQIPSAMGLFISATPRIRQWATATVINMASDIPESARRHELVAALRRASEHSKLWELELMRNIAMSLPDNDSELMTMLTEHVLALEAKTHDEYLAKARVLAQLSQRISPNDVSGSVRRWESIFTAVWSHPRREDILTTRGLQAGFDHLSNTFRVKFNIESSGVLLCRLIELHQAVYSLDADKFMASCSEEELRLRPPPTPLPGTVKPHDPMRAYSSIMVRPIPQVDRLPSHIS